MQKSAYEEYMKNVIGYSKNIETYNRNNNYENYDIPIYEMEQINLENMYPDIYRTIYPMVQKAYNTNTRELNEELIENLTQDIYKNIQIDENKEEENRKNDLLRDLIKILLLRQFLGYRPRPQYLPRYWQKAAMRTEFLPYTERKINQSDLGFKYM